MQRETSLSVKPPRKSYRLALLVKLAKVAVKEGRTLDDLIFEAIEEYLWARAAARER